MKKINDKVELKALADKWTAEMDTRKVQWGFIGISGIFKLWFWQHFAKYRLVYFTQRCCDGMSHVVAWRYAQNKTKEDLIEELKLMGWE